MAAGNPMGLSEIQHFGGFSRVGGKAGGFISKKFFHPSSFRNQERLWKAIEADEQEKRRQDELEKRRDEERQVEALRKQMYLAGQGSSNSADGLFSAARADDPEVTKSAEDLQQAAAHAEEKKRRAQLKRSRRAAEAASKAEPDEGDVDAPLIIDPACKGGSTGTRILAKSQYREDVHVLGHETVWGSWWCSAKKAWGWSCCRCADRSMRCPYEPAPEAEDAAGHRGRDMRGKRRRRGSAADAEPSPSPSPSPEDGAGGDEVPVDVLDTTGDRVAPTASSSSAGQPAVVKVPSGVPDAEALPGKDACAATRTFQVPRSILGLGRKNQQERQSSVDESRSSGYLADLLQEPS